MILEIITDCLRAIQYLILLVLFLDKSREELLKLKNVYMIVAISALQATSNIMNIGFVRSLLPIGIIALLLLYVWREDTTLNRKERCVCVIEAYIISFLINVILGIMCGLVFRIIGEKLEFDGKMIVALLLRGAIICVLVMLFDHIQKHNKMVVSIMVILGAFGLFFQQLMQTAFVTKDYSFVNIIILLIYFTMIFTAFMLLQHNRLTAKQQAIEEDNRQMSQRLHRSKDVLGVVSQVVASEDHIDPKLRKELADFCDDEMNEMQDRALGANLIGDTGIELVNVMLQKQMMRCADLNISFDVMIPAPIDGYIREIGISVTEFMRMLNDLLKNAVKAILSSENTHRELLLIMGDAGNDCFEIRLYDSGVPFPPKILEHLGERGNTTDGTGNGIADTVETLRHYRASFVIEPIEPGTDIYTKCIHIAFDGQGCLPQNGEQ